MEGKKIHTFLKFIKEEKKVMAELDYGRWAEVAQEHGEPMSEPIYRKKPTVTKREQSQDYDKTTNDIASFNAQDASSEVADGRKPEMSSYKRALAAYGL